jgi:hypothetical protein
MTIFELLLGKPDVTGAVTVIVTGVGLCVTSWLSGENWPRL